MQPLLRMAHLVVGALTVGAFLVTGLVMSGHQPPVGDMDWGARLLFRSRHIYILATGLVNLSLGLGYALPAGPARRSASVSGSMLALASAPLLFFAFFTEPMAGRDPGALSAYGLFALFGGVMLLVAANVGRGRVLP